MSMVFWKNVYYTRDVIEEMVYFPTGGRIGTA